MLIVNKFFFIIIILSYTSINITIGNTVSSSTLPYRLKRPRQRRRKYILLHFDAKC